MTGVDTNIIVRLPTGDDPLQAAKAHSIFNKDDIFIPETVILETELVLRHAYGFRPEAIHEALTRLFGLPNVVLPHPHRMLTTLQWYMDGMDFADALHLLASQECRMFLTLDRRLVQKAKGRGTCRVKEL
ncbi:MAG: type II toxin-antitoxin system VapC family toxin [Nitrospirae bacterium]|nr:type II toxin-antitoxin system VapC family toxin [Nitrospirota bacterium]